MAYRGWPIAFLTALMRFLLGIISTQFISVSFRSITIQFSRQFFIIFTIVDNFLIFIIGCVGINNNRLEK